MKLITTLTQTNSEHPPLVLLHGLGSAATIFKSIIPKLSQNFRVITVDLPGHGQTSLDKAQAMDPKSLGTAVFDSVENEYGISRFHVAGCSLGGWIALEMAAQQPERIVNLTGLAPAGLWLFPATGRKASEAIPYYLARLLKPVIKVGLRFKILRKVVFSSVSPQWNQLSYETCYDASIAMVQASGYFQLWDGMITRRFDSKVAESTPVTILFGDRDNTLPAQSSQERSLAPAHCTWLVIESCGHAPMWDHPELIVKIISQAIPRNVPEPE